LEKIPKGAGKGTRKTEAEHCGQDVVYYDDDKKDSIKRLSKAMQHAAREMGSLIETSGM
jgi:hypothetical protein